MFEIDNGPAMGAKALMELRESNDRKEAARKKKGIKDKKMPDAFPLLTAIRKTNGKLAQKAGERVLFEATAKKVRRDFLLHQDNSLPTAWAGDVVDIDPGTVDYRKHTAESSSKYTYDKEDDQPDRVLRTMGVDQKLTIDDETGEYVYGKIEQSQSRKRCELKTVWKPYKAPELKWVKTKLSNRVDNDSHDPIRDGGPLDERVQAGKNLEALIEAMGPDLFCTLQDACLNDDGLEVIGERLGYVDAQRSTAASAVLRMALLRAADVYRSLAEGTQAALYRGPLKKPVTAPSNDNAPAKAAAA